MNTLHTSMLLTLVCASVAFAAKPPEAWIAKGEAVRKAIPLGGDFEPDPKTPTFVAVGHGARILVSRDDGRTWTQAFFGYPGSDHGGWATNAIAHTKGVFTVPLGWVNPTSYLASEDGVHWRHLTNGSTKLSRGDDPSLMPTAMSVAGGNGVFVFSGYMNMTATPDFGKTFSSFSLRKLKDAQAPRKLVTHHVKTVFLGDKTGRFLAYANDRSKEKPRFGNLFASDDAGATWEWLAPKGLDTLKDYSAMTTNGDVVILVDRAGANAYVSADGGETWRGPFTTGAGRGATLSEVNGAFWLTGKPGRVSMDGRTWTDLPDAVPAGKVVASPETGTLINIDRKRYTVLRSTDHGATWTEVYAFEPSKSEHIHGAQGLKDITFGYTTAEPVKR